MTKHHPDAVYIEFVPQGRFVKVTAIDANTGIEASIVGDPKATNDKLKETAIKKLNYVLNKQNNQ